MSLRPSAVAAAFTLFLISAGAPAADAPAPSSLPSVAVRASGGPGSYAADGLVEAVRQADLAVQVSGKVTALLVKAGDRVRAGQLLAKVDARAAEQGANASDAQAEAARASLEVARKDFERQQQLRNQQFISQAAMDQAQARFHAARAQANAQIAAASAARTQSGFYSLVAPFDGIVADVPVQVGDLAMPGRPLLTLYDPSALRVSAHVPQARLAGLQTQGSVRIELPGQPQDKAWLTATRLTVLPTADIATQTVRIRADLPNANGVPLTPGMFARAWLPVQADASAHLFVPTSAVFQRAELQLVYVVDAQGKARLRQIKAGRTQGQETEVLAGLSAQERVARDPLAAAATAR